MPLLVVCATDTEMAAALAWAGPLRLPRQGGSARVVLAGRSCLLLITGVGPVAAALRAGRTIGQTPPSGILCLGVAGTFDTHLLPLGSAAAVCEERFADFGLAGEDGVDPRGIRFAQGVAGGREIFDSLPLDPGAAAAALGLTLPAAWPSLPCLTVSAASGSACAARARATHGCALEAMEGFALAFAAADAGIPFLEVRTASNRVGARPPEDWNLPAALDALGRAAGALFGQA